MNRDNFEHANDSGLGIDLDLGELASSLILAESLVIGNVLAVGCERVPGNPTAYFGE
jgi:hypothetical protein